MKIPKKITPCPIIEAILEIRFNSIIPADANFGIIYNKFQDSFPKNEKLPILQLPEQIRSSDINLIYKPHYKLFSEKFIIQVGPKVFSLATVGEYPGWDEFFSSINKVFGSLFKLNIIENIERMGLRYINIFSDLNIFKKSNLKISLKNIELVNENISLTIAIPSNGFNNRLVIVNSAIADLQKKQAKGSIIDIDTAIEQFPEGALKKTAEFFNRAKKAHNEEKKLFFSLLDEEFLNTLNPEY